MQRIQRTPSLRSRRDGGYPTPEAALDAFLRSPGHREHLPAEHLFCAEQNKIAVGFARKLESEHFEYRTVYIARRAATTNLLPTLHAAADTRPSPAKTARERRAADLRT
jgi:hypothetical protein